MTTRDDQTTRPAGPETPVSFRVHETTRQHRVGVASGAASVAPGGHALEVALDGSVDRSVDRSVPTIANTRPVDRPVFAAAVATSPGSCR
jgi:hypothetical protein